MKGLYGVRVLGLMYERSIQFYGCSEDNLPQPKEDGNGNKESDFSIES